MVDKVMDVIEMIFEKMFGWIVAPFSNLKSIYHHVFGLGPLGGDQSELAYGIFSQGEINDIYLPGMNVFVVLAVTGILIGIVFGGMEIASSGINPANRTFVFAFISQGSAILSPLASTP